MRKVSNFAVGKTRQTQSTETVLQNLAQAMAYIPEGCSVPESTR